MLRVISSSDMIFKLDGIPSGSDVFVSYLVGAEPTDRALREAQRSRKEGIARRHFYGKLHEVKNNRFGEPVLTVLCVNRDDEATGQKQAYRSFNPAFGKILALEVIQSA